MKINRLHKFILPLVLVVLIGLAFLFKQHSSPVAFQVKTFRVTGGWGYAVDVKGKNFIYQPFIPGLTGNKPFPDKNTARKAGNLVMTRLEKGQLPSLSKEDIQSLGLDSLGNAR
jgi:hypothetical protein